MTRVFPSGLSGFVSDEGCFPLRRPIGHMVEKAPGRQACAAHDEPDRDEGGRHAELSGNPSEKRDSTHRCAHRKERVERQDPAEHMCRGHLLKDPPGDRREDSQTSTQEHQQERRRGRLIRVHQPQEDETAHRAGEGDDLDPALDAPGTDRGESD